jgi:hypothetical protein
MNCCDYDCNQGRDCPARVAKVGKGTPTGEPPFEYVPTWRDYLPDLARAVLLVILGMFFGVFIVGVMV